MPDGTATIQSLTGYRVPVRVRAEIWCGDTNAQVCGGTHSGSMLYAIDIEVGTGTPVYNSVESWYNGSGGSAYDETGKGLWLSMWDTARNYIAYHFHLQSIVWDTIWTHEHDGFPVPQGI